MLDTYNDTYNKMRYFYDKKSGVKILYIPCAEMKAQFPNNDYRVVGEIAANHLQYPGELKQPVMQQENFHMQPLGTYKNYKYSLLGYIPCQGEQGDDYLAFKKRKFPILTILLPLFLFVALIVGFLFLKNQNTNVDSLQIDSSAQDYESQLKRPDNIDSSKILIPGYGNFTLQKGSDTIDTVLFNPEDNPCYFQFTLVDETTGDVLYESGLVPPGKGISPIKINKTFDQEGTYPAILKFKTVDFEDTSITYNGSDIEVNLVVK